MLDRYAPEPGGIDRPPPARRQLIKNVLLAHHKTQRKDETLALMARLLDFDDSEKQQVGSTSSPLPPCQLQL
jgi:hypothetical protein